MEPLRKCIERLQLLGEACPGCGIGLGLGGEEMYRSSLGTLQTSRRAGCQICCIILDGVNEFDSKWTAKHSIHTRIQVCWNPGKYEREGFLVWLADDQDVMSPTFRIHEAVG